MAANGLVDTSIGKQLVYGPGDATPAPQGPAVLVDQADDEVAPFTAVSGIGSVTTSMSTVATILITQNIKLIGISVIPLNNAGVTIDFFLTYGNYQVNGGDSQTPSGLQVPLSFNFGEHKLPYLAKGQVVYLQAQASVSGASAQIVVIGRIA
jgi:hypothetical protein